MFTEGTVIKIDPDSPGDTYITKTVPALFPDDTTYINGHYYISSEDDPPEILSLRIYISLLMTYQVLRITPAFSRASYGTFLNPLGPRKHLGSLCQLSDYIECNNSRGD